MTPAPDLAAAVAAYLAADAAFREAYAALHAAQDRLLAAGRAALATRPRGRVVVRPADGAEYLARLVTAEDDRAGRVVVEPV